MPTDWCNQLILYSKLDLSWSNPANTLKDLKLRVRGDWKGMRLRDKVCGYLIFVTSLYAYGDIFVYSLLQLVSFSFCRRGSLFFYLLFSVIFIIIILVISSFVVGFFFLSDEVYM